MLRREALLLINQRRGITKLDYALKDYIQDKILYYTFTQNPSFVLFKGGTALFKVYGSPRFSLDIDLTAENIKFLKTVKKHLRQEGFKVRVVKTEHKGNIIAYTWNIGAKGLGGTGLKLEIKITETPEEYQTITYESVYPDIKPFVMRVITIRYAYKRKLFMLLERNKVRDLFDAYFLAKVYDARVSIDENTWLAIYKQIQKLRSSWKQIEALLINYTLPQFEEVVGVIKAHVEISK